MPFKVIGNDIIAHATDGDLESVWVPEVRDDMESIMLLNSPSSVAAEYITSVLQLLTEPNTKEAWPLYIGHMPDNKNVRDDAGSIKDSPGTLDGKDMRSGEVYQHFGLQIRIRSTDYEEGWIKVANVAAGLDGIQSGTSIIVNGTTYSFWNFSRTSTVIDLGREETGKRRERFAVNFVLAIREEV